MNVENIDILFSLQVRSLEDLKTFSSMDLQQRVVGSSTEHQASSRSHAIIRMEVVININMRNEDAFITLLV